MYKIENNPQVYTTQEGIEETKYNPQVYPIQEGIGEMKNNPQVYTTQEGMQEIKSTLRYTLPKRARKIEFTLFYIRRPLFVWTLSFDWKLRHPPLTYLIMILY